MYSHFIDHNELKDSVLADLRQLSTNALNQDSLMETALKRADLKSIQAQTELIIVQKQLKEVQQEQLELVRTLTRKMIDNETFQMSNMALKDEQCKLKARVTVLEEAFQQEQETEVYVQQFREEIRFFAELQNKRRGDASRRASSSDRPN